MDVNALKKIPQDDAKSHEIWNKLKQSERSACLQGIPVS